MPIRTIIKKNTYFDSVSLMALSTRANNIEESNRSILLWERP